VDGVELLMSPRKPVAQQLMELVDYGCEEVRQMWQVAATVAVVHREVVGLAAGRQVVEDSRALDSLDRLRSKVDQNF
jgi:hypothetical protein